ncbi:HAD-IIIA family hydrolase [Cetobacterium somerae]|uniref:KdsC family phosphatase n=1 Tax=Cetobacterium sp. NK01 TaxID=2993530 RepID=UPI0021167244|nr:HAD-IIIA family hydrolase [Cetobacterium sp. NK01]MCQ8211421.1 HAD-IIIA family hydrolase [Cetobacterium sp. NK01]
MIKLIVLDVDGTLTDGKLYISNLGDEIKAFNVKDGLGITQAISQGIEIAIITGKTSQLVTKRCQELGIKEIHQGIKNKILILDSVLKKYNISYDNVAYMGDDLIDLAVMKKCKLAGAPKDSVSEILSIADFISNKNGGEGAVREFIEYILKKENLWSNVVNHFIPTEQ